MVAVLENPEQTEELLQKMDAALAALPLDFEAYGTNYQQKTELLSELHQYAEGTYTIFPTPEAEPSFAEPSGHQMTMFDFLDTKAVAEPTVVDIIPFLKGDADMIGLVCNTLRKLFCMSDEGYETFLMDLEDYKSELEEGE